VDTVFCSYDGRYLGRFASAEPKNVLLRKRQFDLLDDAGFGLKFCRQVVAGKLTNMATLLMRIQRTRDRKEAGQKAKEIRALFPALEAADSIDSVRGYEGRGSAIYFGGLAWGLQNNLGFHRRVRRPPTDPVNAVLSLLYTFLFNRMYAAIRQAHLDPYPAFLHTIDYGRHSLVMDLMEEFRVIIADTLTLSLFNLKILQKEDFEIERPVPPAPPVQDQPGPDVTQDPYGLITNLDTNGQFDVPAQKMADNPLADNEEDGRGKPGIKLTSPAFKRVIENFERKLTTEFYYPPLDRNITYNDALVAQAGMYRKLVEGTIQEYQPLLLK
jgi:CRISPR-associated protein Cas1